MRTVQNLIKLARNFSYYCYLLFLNISRIYKVLQRTTHELYRKLNQLHEHPNDKSHKLNAVIWENELDTLITLTMAAIVNNMRYLNAILMKAQNKA